MTEVDLVIKAPYLSQSMVRKDGFYGLTLINFLLISMVSRHKGVFFTAGALSRLRNCDRRQIVLRNFLYQLNGMPDFDGMTSEKLTAKVSQAAKNSLAIVNPSPGRLALIPAGVLDEQYAARNEQIRHIIALDEDRGLPFPGWFHLQRMRGVGNADIAEALLPALKPHVPVWRELLAGDGAGKKAAEYVMGTIRPALEGLGKSFSVAIPLPGVSYFMIYKQGIEVAFVC